MKIALSAVALIASSIGAFAADIPARTEAPAPLPRLRSRRSPLPAPRIGPASTSVARSPLAALLAKAA